MPKKGLQGKTKLEDIKMTIQTVRLRDLNVLVEPHVEELQTASGILLAQPEDNKQSATLGTVRSVSNNVSMVQVGDKIFFSNWSPMEVKLEDRNMLVISEDDIMAIIND